MPAQLAPTSERIYKTVPAFLIKADAARGIVDAIVSVMGIIDLGDDIIHRGAYVKTITERVGKIRVLDNHQTFSVRNAVGRPIFLREIGREELPTEIRQEYPMATGGLLTSTQYMLDDEDSEAVFKRILNDFVNEYSIGFDIIRQDMSQTKDDEGKVRVVRNIRELRLYEYSPVLWGMNQATATVDAKSDDEREVIDMRKGAPPTHYTSTTNTSAQRCASCRFYKTENDNAGHCEKFDFLAAAAMTCNDFKPGEAADKSRKEYTPEGPQKRLGDYLRGNVYDKYMAICNELYKSGYLADFEHRQMCDTGMKVLDAMTAGMTEDVAMRPYDPYGMLDVLFFGGEAAEAEKSSPMMELKSYVEAKAGRVLSARNETRLQDAADIIMSVLSDARKEAPQDDDSSASAEPPDQALTDENAKRHLLELDMLSLEMEE